MTTRQYNKLRLFSGTVMALCLLNMILGCRQESQTTKSQLLNKQFGVTVRSPAQSGWKMLKSNERETRFQQTIADEIVVASSKTLMETEFGEGEDLLARLESWKESQLFESGLRRDSLHFYRLRLKGMACLGFDGVYQGGPEDHFNFRGYLFPLVGTEKSAVELEFSSRSKQRGFSEELIQTSEKFFETADLTPAI